MSPGRPPLVNAGDLDGWSDRWQVNRETQGTIRTAWESLVLVVHGVQPTRTRGHGRVNREQLAEIDLHWHDLRHDAACRWLA
jgi:hypothetical protein